MMPTLWALQDAKARLSEVVRQAQKDGLQWISIRGEPAVVVMSRQDYHALTAPDISLIDFLQNSPLRHESAPEQEIEL